MSIYIYIIGVTVLLFSCDNRKNNKGAVGSFNDAISNSIVENKNLLVLDSSIGVIGIANKIIDTIRLYNYKGDVMFKFCFYGYNEKMLGTIPAAFHPWHFSLNNDVLDFKCLGETNGYYKVKINDTTTWLYNKHDTILKLYSWEDYVLSHHYVSLDLGGNKIFTNRNDTLNVVRLESIDDRDFVYYFEAVSIEGEWLKIKWEEKDDVVRFGYVRWRNNSNLLIDFFISD